MTNSVILDSRLSVLLTEFIFLTSTASTLLPFSVIVKYLAPVIKYESFLIIVELNS